MKTFNQLKEWVGFNFPDAGQTGNSQQAVDDVDTAAFAVEQPDVLDKLNAYCKTISLGQFLNPYYPLNTLWKKLAIVGINFDPKKLLLTGEQGRVEAPLNMFGGRYGVLGGPFDHYISQDDGISGRVPGGLKLVVTYQKTGGVYSLEAHIEHGASAVGFGEEAVTESETYNGSSQKCASCKVAPGNPHKANCTGGMHDSDPPKVKKK